MPEEVRLIATGAAVLLGAPGAFGNGDEHAPRDGGVCKIEERLNSLARTVQHVIYRSSFWVGLLLVEQV